VITRSTTSCVTAKADTVLPGGEGEQGPLAGALSTGRWRAYRPDLLAMLVVFAGASLAAGRVWRFPFDDEIYTMAPALAGVPDTSVWDFVQFYLRGGDVHPPLTFLFFASLYDAGGGETALRLISVAMTALSLALWQLLALATVARESPQPLGVGSRLIAVLLFGLSPLAIGQGDAIRWYPQFALSIALFAWLYLAGGSMAARLGSAVPLGLATSINLIAPLVILPFAIYRYGLERRQWRTARDGAFCAIFLLFAAPGLWSAVFVARRQFVVLRDRQFGAAPLRAAGVDLLGFFGGNGVGVGHAWVLVPAVVVAVIAAAALLDRRRPAALTHLYLLLLAMMPVTALVGFDESRSFLYLAPVMAAVFTIFLSRLAAAGRVSWLVVTIAIVILPGLVVIGDLRSGDHPFKRELAMPYDEIIDFVERNKLGDTLLLSTDPVVPWELRKLADPGLCVSYFLGEPACLAPARLYRSVFILSGNSNRPAHGPGMQRFAARVAELTAGREKIAEVRFGQDEDAMLKTRLTGVPLDEFILTVDLYR
jgi:hypothetical protein